MTGKIGFWSVFELVTVSQIGSGLTLPANLAPYGALGLYGWLFSSMGAMILAMMFTLLCLRYPKTGGPHAYVQEAFGAPAAFFTGWTYWVISWVSTTAIITSAVGYLTPLMGIHSPILNLVIEMMIIVIVTAINLKGAVRAGKSKFLLVALKMIPLLLVPVAALFFFDKSNFTPLVAAPEESSSVLNNVMLLTFWGFIGFESATATAGDVKNLRKTLPIALILGTLFVAIVYFISSLGIMGVIPGEILMNSEAPYTDTAHEVFGGYWHLLVSFIACVVCIAAVNAWTLASGQIALGITQDGLMPKFFAKQNKYGAPVFALMMSCLGTLPLLMMTQHENLAQKVNTIIDLSVTAFLFVYIISCLAFLKLWWPLKDKQPVWKWMCGVISLGFCLWIIFSTPLNTLLVACLFVLSGLPIYLIRRNKLKNFSLPPQTTLSSEPST
ncbi:MAG: amino acid permease [Gammaproteobacteria bacterium]|jgi:APA family basic amino acid/polyamine antiporter|nr:amino acid permease [Gammaproteobacteria bacterium]